MALQRVLPGQVFLNSALNQYLVVTKNKKGQVSYKGEGFQGVSEFTEFLSRFGPVDPKDLTDEETFVLEIFTNHPLSTGYIMEEDEEAEDLEENEV